jgi:hypothetical protein
MDDAMIRKRCAEILSDAPVTGDEMILYRAAYADGLEAAASYIASLDQGSKPSAIAAIIRNHAKEMGHE